MQAGSKTPQRNSKTTRLFLYDKEILINGSEIVKRRTECDVSPIITFSVENALSLISISLINLLGEHTKL